MRRTANRIRKGLEEAVAFAKNRARKKHYRVHVPEHVDVKAIRMKLGMTGHLGGSRREKLSWSE